MLHSLQNKRQRERRSERGDNKKHKRGVILLVVVSLLTLMVLIGVTFVLFAQRSLTAARVDQSRNEYREPPEKMFEQVVGQLIYDTVSRSALRGHSLLEDLYGPDFIAGTVANVTPVTGNPNNDNGDQWPVSPPGPPAYGQAFAFQFTTVNPAPILDYYTGRVITFTTGPAAGYSTRILQYDPTPLANNQPPRLHIEAIESSQAISVVPGAGDTFVINGAPFNGVGAGFDDYNGTNPPPPGNSAVLNISAVYANALSVPATLPPQPTDLVALLPHFNGYDPTFGRVFKGVGTPGQFDVPIDQGLALGGFDEPWDAADYQNMFLAMQPPVYAEWKLDGVAGTPDLPLLPSFHRPDLVNYWVNFMQTAILSGLPDPNQQFQVIAQPYGPDTVRNTPDETNVPWSNVPLEQRDRIYNITRCSIFRPMPWDHPNFTGSNQFLVGSGATITGPNARQLFSVLCGYAPNPFFPAPQTTEPPLIPNQNFYDVDNDNDGLPDSIWVDAGLPVVTTPDGKRYKRLVAIMIQDLDGRIDMNAHGNLAQVARFEQPPASGQFFMANRPQFRVPAGGFGLAQGLPGTTTYLPRGLGFGPAEVDFLNLFMNPVGTAFQVDPGVGATMNAVASYENILRGRYESGAVGPGPTPDRGATAVPGVPLTFEPLNQIKHHGVPNDFATWGAWYTAPPDVWGRGAVVLDWGGQPVYAPFAAPVISPTQPIGEMQDNPYELTLSGQSTNADSPYTLAELERMLRYHDYDAQRLQSRPLLPEAIGGAGSILAASAPGIIGPDHTARQRMSGRGAYLPVPSGQVPGTQIVTEQAAGGATPPLPDGSWRTVASGLSNGSKHAGNMTILDMYAGKIANVGGIPPTNPRYFETLHEIVPWELRHGGKFDLNRWLGNGFDSVQGPPYSDGVADDPIEAFADPMNPAGAPFNGQRENGWQTPPAFVQIAEHSNGIDVNNDAVPAAPPLPQGTPVQRSLDRMLARQLYARHLFCLALLFIDPTFDPLMPHEPTLNQAAQRRELFLRRIAQWAINVVDYRDSDAIMTPFEYDINPWNGWDVDSNLATDGSAQNPELFTPTPGAQPQPYIWTGPGPNNNERRLVWGVEDPELLIKETLAFHSRNIRDTPNDTSTEDRSGGDDDPDQLRIPQGSLFIELYNTRARILAGQAANQKPRLPAELYDLSVPGNPRLALGKVAPGGWPVWRIGISELSNDGSNMSLPDTSKPMQMANTNRESASFEPSMPAAMGLEPPRDISLVPAPAGPPNYVTLERFVWFTDPANATGPAGSALANNSFYSNSNVNPLLQPGQYAVVCPRLTTYIGSKDPALAMPPPPAGSLWGGWSPQALDFAAPNLAMAVTDTAGTSTTPAVGTAIRDAVPIVADMANVTPNGWMNPARWNIGLNITEPLPSGNYYPEPPDLSPYPMNYPIDAYDDLDAPTGTFLDEPADYTRVLDQHQMIETRTYPDVASVYLQRLANPNLPWNQFGNPYITVDWASVDVSVFAGDENTNQQVTVMGMMEDLETLDPFVGAPGRPMNWETRQRGSTTAPPVPPFDANVWRPVTTLSTMETGHVNAVPGELYFDLGLVDAMGNPLHTLSWLSNKLGQPMSTPMFAASYVGDIAANPNPFPWLVHQDRPFANPYEILTVPASSSVRLCFEFTPGDLSGALGPNPYDFNDPTNLRTPFAHLLNFFHTEETGTKPTALSPQFQRMFDYIEVPSPYVGAERWFNPATNHFDNAGLYRPPFNKLSRFRDPGRMNINTIYDDQIFLSAFGHLWPFDGARQSTFLNKLFRSRQGYGAVGSPAFVMDPNFPTMFANPFRPLDAADLMPDVPANQLSMRKNGQIVPASAPPQRRGMPVEATFFRPDPDIGPNRVPLFDFQATAPPIDTYHNTQRNAYFRYQVMQKLGNTFSTNSNVFAVWLTIGYFEVEDNTYTVQGSPLPQPQVVVDSAHPDGLRLGPEIGADSGEIVRHRAFYIIDRSVPVGHVPGQKLNSENCILLRRMIE